jgi:hypothetical protein
MRARGLGGAAATLVQYGLAYGVGVPVYVLYRIGRRVRRRGEPPVDPRQP